MKVKRKQFGLSLTEILTSIVIIVLLAAMSMPAIRALENSLSSTGSGEAMISAALSNARAIAMKEQRYAGVRFQLSYNNSEPNNPFASEQYMTFVINEPTLVDHTILTVPNGYCAIKGFKPIKLPSNIGVMEVVGSDGDVINKIFDKTTFTIVFSPTGNLIIRSAVYVLRAGPADEVFNNPSQDPMFRDDYEDAFPFRNEPSGRSFVIYEQNKLKQAYEQGVPYSGYLKPQILDTIGPTYINSYTGTIISTGTK